MSERGPESVSEERGAEPAPAAPRQWQTDMLSDLFRYPLDAGYTDAAAARRKHGPLPAGTKRVRRVVTVVACLIIGVLFSVAYLQVVERAPGRATARAGLIGDIRQRQEHTDGLARRARTTGRAPAADAATRLANGARRLRAEAQLGGPVTGTTTIRRGVNHPSDQLRPPSVVDASTEDVPVRSASAGLGSAADALDRAAGQARAHQVEP